MNTFNLTFQGRVLPGHDPKQVKTGFAELFCLDDPAVVEEVFSGAQVILRSDLDRKSAAEYFSKIKKLGGEAALVESSAFRPEPGQTIIKLLQEDRAPARIERETVHKAGMDREILIRGEHQVDQSWPVSSARRVHLRQKAQKEEEARRAAEAAEQARLQAAEEATRQREAQEVESREQLIRLVSGNSNGKKRANAARQKRQPGNRL